MYEAVERGVMSVESIGRPIGTCFALTAFAIAIASGLLAQNDAVTVLGRAIVVLVACRVVGAMLGWVMARVAAETLVMQGIVAEAAIVAQAALEADVEVIDEVDSESTKDRRAA